MTTKPTERTSEDVLAQGIANARRALGLARSDLARLLAEAGCPGFVAWRGENAGRITAEELAYLQKVLENRLSVLRDRVRDAEKALIALPTVATIAPKQSKEKTAPAARAKAPAPKSVAKRPAVKKSAPPKKAEPDASRRV